MRKSLRGAGADSAIAHAFEKRYFDFLFARAFFFRDRLG
jgi:hypothetical protein